MRLTVLGGCGAWPAAGQACSGYLDDAIDLREFTPGDGFSVGPFGVHSWLLPHFVPNAGLRLESGGRHLAYTGDSGPSPDLLNLALGADLLLAEASCARQVPDDSARYLSSASQAGQLAHRAGAGQLILTHLVPGTDPPASVEAAAEGYGGPIAVATPGLIAEP